MQELRDVLERAEPLPEEHGDWNAVVRRARPRRPMLVGSLAGIAVAAVALFALVLFQPWAVEQRTFLERALAAVDNGPVIHAVLRHGEGGTNVDLQTGARTPVHSENELWYDVERRLLRSVFRIGDAALDDSSYDPGYVPREIVALGRDYRTALRSGSARIAGEDVVDGERVTWITFHSEQLPDSSDEKLHEWAQQVAVSNETFKPVAIRDARDGRPGPSTLQRVIELETLPADAIEFPQKFSFENSMQQGHEVITAAAAPRALGRNPLWLGEEHAGLPLTQVRQTYTRRGRTPATRVSGPSADDARACSEEFRRQGLRGQSEACQRMRERGHGLHIQGETVYELGPTEWGEKLFGVSFAYGAVEDPFRPLTASTEPYVYVAEARERSALVQGAAYFPPPGFVSLAGTRSGSVVVDGLYVVIHASSEELILSAARALKPMS